jgi:hypothetical protein
LTAVTDPVEAQQTQGQYPPACDATKVTKSDVDRAHTVFLSGKQYLEESNYDKAISYFKDAYSIDCSIHAILPIIATAYERKGDRSEAVHALEEYQKRAPTAPDHEVIDRRIRNLKDQIARDQPAPAASSAAPPPPASAAPTASAASTATASAVAPPPPPSASGGPPSAPPEAEGGHSVAPWIVVGAGGVAVVAGVVVYAIGSGDVSSAANNCPNHRCPMNDTSDVSTGNTGRSMETAGGVVLGVGAAAAAVGLVWHFLEPTSPAATAAAHVTPVLAPASGGSAGFTGLSVSGAF